MIAAGGPNCEAVRVDEKNEDEDENEDEGVDEDEDEGREIDNRSNGEGNSHENLPSRLLSSKEEKPAKWMTV